MTTTQDPETVVRRVALAAVKARSIAAENEGLEVAAMLDPTLYGEGDLSILTVCDRVLDCQVRQVQPIDAMNVLYLAGRSEGLRLMYAIRWEEELPEPASALSL